jgi:hypothetical protein
MQALHKSILVFTALLPIVFHAQSSNAGSTKAQAGTSKENPITGTAAYADWTQQKPGIFRRSPSPICRSRMPRNLSITAQRWPHGHQAPCRRFLLDSK